MQQVPLWDPIAIWRSTASGTVRARQLKAQVMTFEAGVMIVGTTLMAASYYILACLFMHAVFIYPNNHIFKVVTQPYAIKDVASLVYCVHNQFLRATWDIYDPGSMKSNRAMATVTQWSLSHDKPDCTDNTTTHKSHHVPLHVATFHKV